MKQVYVANNPTEAHIVRGRLHAARIRAFVQGENLYAIRGGVGMTDAMPSVWVDDADYERASRLLAGDEDLD